MLWSYPIKESQGGFIDTATGAFTPDPSSVLVYDFAKNLYRTPDQPYLYGNWGGANMAPSSYDVTAHRWVPVPPQWVSPDGKSYAYGVASNAPGAGIHVVDVATGVDRVIASTTSLADGSYFVAGYLSDGIYLNEFGPTGGAGLGLWRLDPSSGAIDQVSTSAPALGVLIGETPIESPPSKGNPDAWWTNYNRAFDDTSDPYVYFQYLNTSAGQNAESWFSQPGFHVNVIGADAEGHAIVEALSTTQAEVWLLATPNSASPLQTIPRSGAARAIFRTAVADRGGWWIGSESGLIFATASTWGQVSTTPVVVAGACV
ncbi:MAG TPA: hypothetical protein VFL29_12725 [Candidatus Dormibacteraeota bacterium]|nr:hypothetical protein [Candidatus Dormibacteraeota bacterium]